MHKSPNRDTITKGNTSEFQIHYRKIYENKTTTTKAKKTALK